MKSLCIHYFIPQLGEDESSLNGYLIPKPAHGVKLDLVKTTFPIKGASRFRALCKYNREKVFLDLTKDDQLIPDFNNKIILKVELAEITQ